MSSLDFSFDVFRLKHTCHQRLDYQETSISYAYALLLHDKTTVFQDKFYNFFEWAYIQHNIGT